MDLALLADRTQRAAVYVVAVGVPIVILPSTADTFGLPKATLLVLGAVAVTVASAVRAAADRRILVPWTPLAAALGAFAVGLVVATVTSGQPMLSVVGDYTRYAGLAGYGGCVLVALAVLRVFLASDVRSLLWCIAGASAIVALYGALQVAGADPYDWAADGFAGTFATLGNANFLAGFLAIGLPIVVWVALDATLDRRLRFSALALVVLVVPVMVATKSVQGPVAGAAGLTVAGVVWWRTGIVKLDERVRRRLVAAMAVVAVLLVIVALPELLDRLKGGIDGGLLERRAFWSAALSMAGDDPVTGVGLDTYGQHFLAARPAEHALTLFNTQAEAAHSVPLNMLATGGVVLAAAYLAVVVMTAIAAVRGLRRTSVDRSLLGALVGSWVAYQVQSLVSIDVPALAVLHFVLAGAIAVVAVDPPLRELVLPGPAVRRAGGRRGTRIEVPSSTYAVMAGIAVVAVVAGWQATRPLRADLTAVHAQNQFSDGDLEGALASLERATDLAPWQGRYWLLRTQLSEATREVFDATDFAEEAARREPGSGQYALLAGRLNLRYRDVSQAREWFESAIARDPKNPLVLAEVAAFEAEAGDLDQATRLIERAEALAPDAFQVAMGRGRVEEAAGNIDAARAAYEHALELSPGLGEAIVALRGLDAEDGLETP